MKFLEKIEDLINGLLVKLITLIKNRITKAIPESVPKTIEKFKLKIINSIFNTKAKILETLPKIKTALLKIIGHIQHGIHVFKGTITQTILFIKSDEFRSLDKKAMVNTYFKSKIDLFFTHPIRNIFSVVIVISIFASVKTLYFQSKKLMTGIKVLRAPASERIVTEKDLLYFVGAFHFKVASHHDASHSGDHDTHQKADDGHGGEGDKKAEKEKDPHAPPKDPPPPKDEKHGASAGDHGAPPDAHGGKKNDNTPSPIQKFSEVPVETFHPKPFQEEEFNQLKVYMKYKDIHDRDQDELEWGIQKNFLPRLKKEISHIHFEKKYSYPLTEIDQHALDVYFKEQLKNLHNEFPKEFDFHKFTFWFEPDALKKPSYHLATLRQYKFEHISLQLMLEDINRNKQVYIDFIIQLSNREGLKILEKMHIEIKDYLFMNVEPVVPGLPLDDEGKRIIRDKVKFEINDYFKKHHLDTEVEEIYIDYILSS